MRNLIRLVLAAACCTASTGCGRVVLGIPGNKQVVLNRTGYDLTCQLGSAITAGDWGPAFVIRDRGQWSRQPAKSMIGIRCGPPGPGEGFLVQSGKRLAYVVVDGRLDLIELKK